MARAYKEWTVYSNDGFSAAHKVVLNNNRISIDGAEPVKLRQFRPRNISAGLGIGTVCDIDLGDRLVQLYIFNSPKREPVLAADGKDCATGLEFQAPQTPKWTWVFTVLYAINFFVLVGGAIGAVAWVLGVLWTANTAAFGKGSTAVKVLKCIGIYLVVTAASFAVGLAFMALMDSI